MTSLLKKVVSLQGDSTIHFEKHPRNINKNLYYSFRHNVIWNKINIFRMFIKNLFISVFKSNEYFVLFESTNKIHLKTTVINKIFLKSKLSSVSC